MDRYGNGKVMLIGPAGKNTSPLVEFAKVRPDGGPPAAQAAVAGALMAASMTRWAAAGVRIGRPPMRRLGERRRPAAGGMKGPEHTPGKFAISDENRRISAKY